MSPPQLTQSNVASLPPPEAGVAAWLEPQSELTPFPDLKPLRPALVLPVSRYQVQLPRGPSPAGPVLAAALNTRWQSYVSQLGQCQQDFSEESIHQLRVATRRMIAQLVLLRCITPGPTAGKACRVLKRRLKALGELRDTQVQRLFLERHAARFPELILVRDFLEGRERRLEKAAAARLRGFKTRKLEKWTATLSGYLIGSAGVGGRSNRITAAIERATGSAFAEVVQRRQAIVPADAATIHQTRLAFKKFRYIVESLSPHFTDLTRRELRALA